MKTSIRLTSILLAIVLMFSLAVVTMAASGAPATKSGIEASLSTDKDSYVTGDKIDAIVTVKNNSGKKADIAVAITVPQGLTLTGKANYNATIQDGKSHKNAPPAATGDASMPGLVMVMGIVAIGAFVALLMMGKNNRAVMSLLLVLTMVFGFGVMAVPAQAVSETIDLTCPIKLDGKDANVTATIEFTLTEIEVLYENTFDNEDALEGWGVAPASGIPAGAEVGVVDGKFRVYVPNTISTLASRTLSLATYSGKITFEMDISASFPEGSKETKSGIAIVVNNESSKPAVAIYVRPKDFSYYNIERVVEGSASPGQTGFGSYPNGTTCTLKIVADTTTDLYDIYINGELQVSGIKFRNNASMLTKLQLGSGATDVGATVTFDNLKITTEK